MSVYRRIYSVIDPVLRQGAYLSETLNNELFKSSEDGAFITSSVYGVFDHLIQIDYILNQLMKSRPKPAVLSVLRLGTYLIRFSDTPIFAAVNGCVELCKEIGKKEVGGFVNAVLKRANLPLVLPKEPAFHLSVKYSYPLWMVKKLLKEYKEQTETLLSPIPAGFEPVRINTKKTSTADFTELLKSKNISNETADIENCLFADFAALLKQNIDESLYVKQNLGSVLIGNLFDFNKPCRVLDACAAPGGKTVILSQNNPQGTVLSADIHEHRLKLIESYCKRFEVINVETVLLDAAVFHSEYENAFDCVLLDVPCSGLGILNQKPDIKYLRKEGDIASLTLLQRSILSNCSRYVKNGGQLVYSTCTMLSEENEEVVKDFLAENKEYVVVKPNLPEKYLSGDFLKLLPNINGKEGFFAVKMVKHD